MIRVASDDCCVVVAENSWRAWADVVVFRLIVHLCCCFLPVHDPFPSCFHLQLFAVVDVVGPTNLVVVEDEPPDDEVVLNAYSSIGFPLW